MASKVKEIFKGNASDADKSEAFTGETTKDTPKAGAPSGVGSSTHSGESTSAFTGDEGGKDLPGGNVGQKGASAAGLGSQAQSGVS